MKILYVAETSPYQGNLYLKTERVKFAKEIEAQQQAAKWQAEGKSSQVWLDRDGHRVLLHSYPTH